METSETPAIDKRIDDYDWQHIFEGGEGYTRPTHVRTKAVREGSYSRVDIASVLAVEDGENDGPEWVGLFRMKDGKYLTVRAGCDYTGWGCQESGNSDVADSLEDAIAFGLSQDERTRLGSQLPKAATA